MTTTATKSALSPARGVEERMRALYEVNSPSLLLTVLGWTRGDRQAAEDLVQETMIHAWRNLDSLRGDPRATRAWLLMMSRRLAVDSARDRATRPVEVGIEDEPVAHIPGGVEPYEQVLDREVLRLALRELSAIHRAVLVQVYFLNRPVRQTAQALGVPEGTVKSRTYNALRALRRQLGDLNREPPC